MLVRFNSIKFAAHTVLTKTFLLGTRVGRILLLLLVFLISATATAEANQRYELKVCAPKANAAYVIQEAPTCDNITIKNTLTFTVNVSFPQADQWVIPAWSCAYHDIVTIHYWNLIYGDYTKVDSDKLVPAPAEICESWVHTLIDRKLGMLTPVEGTNGEFKTTNKVAPTYNWPYQSKVVTRNAVISKTEIQFSGINGLGTHYFDSLTNCKAGDGVCLSSQRTYIFEAFQHHCKSPGLQPLINRELQVHIGENQNYMLVKGTTLAFNTLLQCPDKTISCFEPGIFLGCTPTRFVISSNDKNAHVLSQPHLGHDLLKERLRDKFQTESTVFSEELAQSLQSIATEFDVAIIDLKEQFMRLHCIHTRAIINNMRAVQSVAPSITLSYLLHRDTKAISSGEILYELDCAKTLATLHPTLWYEGKFLAFPIFTIYFGGASHIAQLSSDKYLTIGVRDFMHPNEGIILYTINGKAITFKNGTLVKQNIPLHEVTLPGVSTKVNFKPVLLDTNLLVEEFRNVQNAGALTTIRRAISRLIDATTHQFQSLGISSDETSSILSGKNSHKTSKVWFSRIRSLLSPSNWLAITKTASVIVFTAVILTLLFYATAVVKGLFLRFRDKRQRTAAAEEAPQLPN